VSEPQFLVYEIIIPASGDDEQNLQSFRKKCLEYEGRCFGKACLTAKAESAPVQLLLNVSQSLQLASQVLDHLGTLGLPRNGIPVSLG
jgi:hypothetical protein